MLPNTRKRPGDIRAYLLEGIDDNPGGIVTETAAEFGITRQGVLRHVRQLVVEGRIAVQGKTRDRRYRVIPTAEIRIPLGVSADLQEDLVWRQDLRPALDGVRSNVLAVCQYGLTEMLRNVVDHSQATHCVVSLDYSPHRIRMEVGDNGVGIFAKIQKAFDLPDPQDAILELAKGKLTTDPQHHTGEGIFFTSRMFDRFSILSGRLSFAHLEQENDWLLEEEAPVEGTLVSMIIGPSSDRTPKEVFDRFASQDGDYGFSKTHVPVVLARYGDENLVSRSQAKRLLARFDRFQEIILDFKGVATVGQAFADEIFRVFALEHPHVHLTPVNLSQAVAQMVNRARANSQGAESQAP
jgi:anti-sigma regulatory factor (Ser/Thr protein kinase)